MSRASTCLFVTPVLPTPTGGGIQLRAFWLLRALASRHRVVLVTASSSPGARAPEAIRPFCDEAISLELDRDPGLFARRLVRRASPGLFHWLHGVPRDLVPVTRQGARLLARSLGGQPVELVHCFRLCMMPVALHLLEVTGAPASQLDLDDIESRTRARLAALHRDHREPAQARAMAREAVLCEGLERRAARRFGRLLACSATDKRVLLEMGLSCPIAVVPNVVPSVDARPREPSGRFTLLFVGSHGYFPNREGIVFFSRQVLPRIQRECSRPVRLVVVGRGMTRALRRSLAGIAGVELVGEVDDLLPHYARADAVVAPLRAGGGTRIKILEAFAHRRPVVSTSIGAEGLEVSDGEQLLLADTAEAFARQCLRLADEVTLGERLAASALAYVGRSHAPELASAALDTDPVT